MSRNAYIKTYGCQMNEHDTQRMYAMLDTIGYLPVETPDDADVILVNTCSVRANPENKVYSFLGALRPLKQRKPELIVGVAGCVAQQVGETLLNREPLVDFVFGPDNLFRLPEFIEDARHGERGCHTDWQPWEGEVREFVPEAFADGQINWDTLREVLGQHLEDTPHLANTGPEMAFHILDRHASPVRRIPSQCLGKGQLGHAQDVDIFHKEAHKLRLETSRHLHCSS